MKKLLLSISLLIIIISFQSCSKYPDNEGGSVFSKKFRLVGTEWVSTEVIVTSIEYGYYNDDLTEFLNYEYTFNRDGTFSCSVVLDYTSTGGDIFTNEITGEYDWQNNKEEIYFYDDGYGEGRTWEIRRLDLLNFWVISTNSSNDFIYEIKMEAAN